MSGDGQHQSEHPAGVRAHQQCVRVPDGHPGVPRAATAARRRRHSRPHTPCAVQEIRGSCHNRLTCTRTHNSQSSSAGD